MSHKSPFIMSILAAYQLSSVGATSLDGDLHHLHPRLSIASSFMHFHGPVEGPELEVKVPYVLQHTSEHNHVHDGGQDPEEEDGIHHDQDYSVDYFAHPKYEFSYGVEDHHTGDFHGQKETRDGSSVSGEYSVQEPGGSMRVVTYRADKDGFHAVVHTSGKNDHSGASYSPEASHGYHPQQHHVQEQVQVHEQPDDEGHEFRKYDGGYGDKGYN